MKMGFKLLLFSIAVVAFAGSAQATVGQDLLLIFNSSANLNDQSGNGLNFAQFGSLTYGADGGYGVKGFSTGNYISRNPGLLYYNQYVDTSLTVGFNFTTGATGDQVLVSNGNGTFGQNTFVFMFRSSYLTAAMYNGSEYEFSLCDVDFTPDSEYHVFTWSWNATSQQARCWLDGVATTGTTRIPTSASSDRSRIGVRQGADLFALNASIYWLALDARPLSSEEALNASYINMDWYTSTVPTPELVNITVGSTAIRTLPNAFRRYHVANSLGAPYKYPNGTYMDPALQAAVYNSVDLKGGRWDVDFGNICQSYSGNPTNPCVWSTSNTSNFANINIHKAAIAIVAASGGVAHLVNDGPAPWMADNSSKCTYGSLAPDFNYTSCDFFNHTIAANAFAQYMEEIGCTTTYTGVCLWEGRNEPYLTTNNASGTGTGKGQFYYRNASATCAQRTAGMVAEWSGIFPLLKARIGSDAMYAFPSVNYGYAACGPVVSASLMGNFTYGSANAPDYANTHEYSSSDPPDLIADYATANAAFNAAGWNGSWIITETELNNNAINTNSPEVHAARLMEAFLYVVQNTTAQAITFFQFYGSETYTMWTGLQLDADSIKAGGLVMNASRGIDTTATTVYPCTTTNSFVTCSYVKVNNTKGILMLGNKQNSSVIIDKVSVTGESITASTSNTNGSTQTVTGGKVSTFEVGTYGFDGYSLTLDYNYTQVSYATTSPAENTTVPYPTIQTFTVTITNPDNLTAYYSWFIDGVNQTSLYGSTSVGIGAAVGNYNITNTVLTSLGTISYEWNYTVTSSSASTAACVAANKGNSGLLEFTSILSNLVIMLVLVVVLTTLYGLYNQLEYTQIAIMIGINLVIGVVAVLAITFIVSFGSIAALSAAGC